MRRDGAQDAVYDLYDIYDIYDPYGKMAERNDVDGASDRNNVNGSKKPKTRGAAGRGAGLAPAAAVLALVLLATGCVTWSWPTPGGESRIVRATGFHRIKGAALPDLSVPEVPGAPAPRVAADSPSWAGETLEEKVTVPLPSDANSQIEAMMVARRQASDEALRQIGERLAAQPTPDGGTLGAMLDADGALKTRVEQVVRSATRLEDAKENVEGTFSLVARLDEALIVGQIWPEGPAMASPGREPAPRRTVARTRENDPVLAQASALAERQARANLLHAIQQRGLTPGYTIGERMTADPAAAEKARAVVREAPVVSVRYPDNESCEVVVELDLGSLLTWLQTH